MFDVSKEEENPINPIYGQSLLLWLKDKVSNVFEIDEPDAEDWGWYTYINWKGRNYLIGSSSDEGQEWVFQVDKIRSFSEKLFGKEKMTEGDECFQFFKRVFDEEPEFGNVQVE